MFRRYLPRPKKRVVFFVFMTSVLGITLYCTLCLNSSNVCLVDFINIKQHYFSRRTKIHFPWNLFIESYPLSNAKKNRRKKSKKRSSTLRNNKNNIVLNNHWILLPNVINSTSIDKQEQGDFGTRRKARTMKYERLKKDMQWAMVDANNNLSTTSEVVHYKNIPSRIKQHTYHSPHKQSKNLMNVSAHSCKPLYPKVVLYNRIFKTASTTMSSFLERSSRILKYALKKEFTEEWSNEKMSHPVLIHIRERAKRSKRRRKRLLAVAHFYFRINSGLNMKHTYINILREPVQRFISHYYYVRSPTRWAKRLRRLKARGHWNVTLEQCIDKQYEGCKRNLMTRFFCGPDRFCKTGSEAALSRAKYNMRHYYSSIGVVEHLNEFVQVLHKRLPKFIIKSKKTLGKKFVTFVVKKKPISSSVIARIVQVNQVDIELYNYAKNIFLKQAKQCGIRIKR